MPRVQQPSASVQQPPAIRTARAVVTALRRAGVRRFVLSPGSRSAPLAYALQPYGSQPGSQPNELKPYALKPCEVHVQLDERDAGFFALGLAQASSAPVAVIVTSGTAVANLHPAVLEADLARVPLVLLTADRPASLRGKLASQTIEQFGIFGSAVRCLVDLPVGVLDADAQAAIFRAIRQAANLAYPGPVQINIQFDGPLYPALEDPPPPIRQSIDSVTAFAESSTQDNLCVSHPSDNSTRNLGLPYLPGDPTRTIVIAGAGAGLAARQLAEANGWPLLAEPTSGAVGSANAVIGGRYLVSLLGDTVEHAIVFGRPTLSRQVIQLLADPAVAVTVVAPGGGSWPDAWCNTARVLGGINPSWRHHSVTLNSNALPTSRFLQTWLTAANQARQVLNVASGIGSKPIGSNPIGSSLDGLSPIAVARAIAQAHFRTPGNLVVGASNPIRDLDLVIELEAAEPASQALGTSSQTAFSPTSATLCPNLVGQAQRIYSNRGVAGIDGTIATALGIAAANNVRSAPGNVRARISPAGCARVPITTNEDASISINRLYLGDLTFWHDASALRAAAHETAPQLQIVVANDQGGSIFAELEHGQWAAQSPGNLNWFERVFATPQQGDIGLLCAAYGVPYTQVSDEETLQLALKRRYPGVEVIDVRVDRQNRRAGAATLGAAIARSVDSVVTGAGDKYQRTRRENGPRRHSE